MKSLEESTAAIQQINLVRHLLTDDGNFPNNSLLSLIVYQRALISDDNKIVVAILESNGWVNTWGGSIYE